MPFDRNTALSVQSAHMAQSLNAAAGWILGPEPVTQGRPGHLVPRWIFLRALALIYFSAFYSLLLQIKGLIGPNGVLPAQDYLADLAQQLGLERYWYAPSLYWISSSSAMMMTVTWVGLIASVISFLNL